MFCCPPCLGEKGDTCIQCSASGPPGLPGTQGPKGNQGSDTWYVDNFSNEWKTDLQILVIYF